MQLFCQRTLEKVRWGGHKNISAGENIVVCQNLIGPSSQRRLSDQRRLSSLRAPSSLRVYTISDLMQSIKGNFSREIHVGRL